MYLPGSAVSNRSPTRMGASERVATGMQAGTRLQIRRLTGRPTAFVPFPRLTDTQARPTHAHKNYYTGVSTWCAAKAPAAMPDPVEKLRPSPHWTSTCGVRPRGFRHLQRGSQKPPPPQRMRSGKHATLEETRTSDLRPCLLKSSSGFSAVTQPASSGEEVHESDKVLMRISEKHLKASACFHSDFQRRLWITLIWKHLGRIHSRIQWLW